MRTFNLKKMFLFWLLPIGVMAASDTCTICGDSLTIISATIVVFPLTMPGDTILIGKALNKSGEVVFLSNSHLIKTAADLYTCELNERNAAPNGYSHIGNALQDTLSKKNDTDTVRVKVYLRDLPNTRTPLMDKPTFLATHGLKEVTLQNPTADNDYKTSSDIFVADMQKNDIISLSFDVTISTIEQYIVWEWVNTILPSAIPSLRNNIVTREYFSINGKKISKKIFEKNNYMGTIVIISEKSISGARIYKALFRYK